MDLAFEISALPCGCYRREGDGRWFYLPNCPLHGVTPPPPFRSPMVEQALKHFNQAATQKVYL